MIDTNKLKEKIIYDWLDYNLRKERPYVNFDFELDPVNSKNLKKSVDRALNNINKIIFELLEKSGKKNIILDVWIDKDDKNVTELLNHVVKKNDYFLKGSCDFETFKKFIYQIVIRDFQHLCKEQITSARFLFYIREIELFLYIYDGRGGIICSLTNNKVQLKQIFDKFPKLINVYHKHDMITKLEE